MTDNKDKKYTEWQVLVLGKLNTIEGAIKHLVPEKDCAKERKKLSDKVNKIYYAIGSITIFVTFALGAIGKFKGWF